MDEHSPSAQPAPAGWKLVPTTATAQMMDAGEAAFASTANPTASWAEHTGAVYAAMIAAAPAATQAQAITYTHADVTAAHTEGYKLGMAQRTQAQPVQCLRCGFVTHVKAGESPADTTHDALMKRTEHLSLAPHVSAPVGDGGITLSKELVDRILSTPGFVRGRSELARAAQAKGGAA